MSKRLTPDKTSPASKGDAALCVVVVAVVLFALLWQYLVAWVSRIDRSTIEIATWAQAIVTFFGIIGGAGAIAWQVRRQHSQDERLRQAEAVRRLQMIASGMFHALVTVNSIGRHSANGVEFWRELDQLDQHVGMLVAIPTLDIPDWPVARAIAEAAGSAARLRRDLTSLASYQHEPYINVAIICFEELEREIQSALQARGSDVPGQAYSIDDGTRKHRYRSASVSDHDAGAAAAQR